PRHPPPSAPPPPPSPASRCHRPPCWPWPTRAPRSLVPQLREGVLRLLNRLVVALGRLGGLLGGVLVRLRVHLRGLQVGQGLLHRRVAGLGRAGQRAGRGALLTGGSGGGLDGLAGLAALGVRGVRR